MTPREQKKLVRVFRKWAESHVKGGEKPQRGDAAMFFFEIRSEGAPFADANLDWVEVYSLLLERGLID